jgi:hypothetical protein
MRTVAALYVDPLGPYPSMAGVDWWGVHRDALKYRGPDPVVAHPPCAPWSKMRWLSKAENRQRDRGCAIRALRQVQTFGGVLEHPEHSQFWPYAGLPGEWRDPDRYSGRTYYVNQLAWGHTCSKPTWLYIVGVDHDLVMSGVQFGGTPTHCLTRGVGTPPGLKVAHSSMRSRSPIAFAEWLVSLARTSSVNTNG